MLPNFYKNDTISEKTAARAPPFLTVCYFLPSDITERCAKKQPSPAIIHGIAGWGYKVSVTAMRISPVKMAAASDPATTDFLIFIFPSLKMEN
jgi:hypothetical protein